MGARGQIEDADLAISGSGCPSEPTIVLAHGAVEDSSHWTHGVIQGLQRDGFPVKVFSNPLRGLAVDAAYPRALLSTIDGSVILVSHAYGGAVITQAGGDFASSFDLTEYTLPDGTKGTYALVQVDKYGSLLAADVPESVLALMIATQRPVDLAW